MAASALRLDSQSPLQPPGGWLGVRHAIALLLFLGLMAAYALRVNLSVAIVPMTNSTSGNEDFKDYPWGSQERNTVLSSFFWGYVVTQVPAGLMAQRWGAHWLLAGGVALAAALSLLSPLAADGGWQWLCAARVGQGLGQGVVFPCVHTLLSQWAPAAERGRLATYVYAGAQVGTIVAMPASSALAVSAAGWPAVFYVFGALGVGWAALWLLAGARSPAAHRCLPAAERAYIEATTGASARGPARGQLRTPWRAILTSPPVWALVVAHSGHNWGFWTLLTEIPTYMSDVLGFDLKNNGLYSALPYLVMWLLSFGFSWLADWANQRRLLSLAASRKLFNTIGHWGAAAALVGLAFVEEQGAAVALLTVAVGLTAANYVGFQVNHIDLSPNFAGTLMGLTNCVANIMSIIGPLLVGVIVKQQDSREQWRVVFFVAAGFYLLGNLLFVVMGRAEVQPWNEIEPAAADADPEAPPNSPISKDAQAQHGSPRVLKGATGAQDPQALADSSVAKESPSRENYPAIEDSIATKNSASPQVTAVAQDNPNAEESSKCRDSPELQKKISQNSTTNLQQPTLASQDSASPEEPNDSPASQKPSDPEDTQDSQAPQRPSNPQEPNDSPASQDSASPEEPNDSPASQKPSNPEDTQDSQAAQRSSNPQESNDSPASEDSSNPQEQPVATNPQDS